MHLFDSSQTQNNVTDQAASLQWKVAFFSLTKSQFCNKISEFLHQKQVIPQKSYKKFLQKSIKFKQEKHYYATNSNFGKIWDFMTKIVLFF